MPDEIAYDQGQLEQLLRRLLGVNCSQTGPAPSLSGQECEALRLYLTGMTLQSVALRMNLAPCTVKQYLDRVRTKYEAAGQQVRTRHQLLIAAHRDGLLTSS